MTTYYSSRPSIVWRELQADRVEVLDRLTKKRSVVPAVALRVFEFCATPRDRAQIRDLFGLDDESWSHIAKTVVVEDTAQAYAAGGNRLGKFYEWLPRLFPDDPHVFLNHGYGALDGNDDFSWIRAEDGADNATRYGLNLARELLSGVDVTAKRVLDIGCGRGGCCAYIAGYLRPKEVIGVDHSWANVEFCRGRHRAQSLSFLRADAQALPFVDASVDVVLNVESSHCYPNLIGFLTDVHRVIAPDGVFIYTDSVHPYEVEFHVNHLALAGFETVEYRDVAPNVGRSMIRQADDYKAFIERMAVATGRWGREIAEWIASELPRRASQYLEGTFSYPLWVLKKASGNRDGRRRVDARQHAALAVGAGEPSVRQARA